MDSRNNSIHSQKQIHSQRKIDSQNSASSPRSRLHIEIMDEPCLRGDNLEYDDIDLLSECSTPATYVPGRFLQLCDITPDISYDVTLWPVSGGPIVGSDVDATPLLSSQQRHHGEEEGQSLSQSCRKPQRLTLRSPRLLIPIAVCMIVALTALGGLATIL